MFFISKNHPGCAFVGTPSEEVRHSAGLVCFDTKEVVDILDSASVPVKGWVDGGDDDLSPTEIALRAVGYVW